jgi:hypothetical protein
MDTTADTPRFNNFYDEVDDMDFFFRSLYISYDITNEITIGAGVLPFSNSASSKYNYDYIQDGEGIYMLNDNALTSVFVKYKSGNSRTIFGIGAIDNIIVPSGDYIAEDLKENSYSIFLINNYNIGQFEIVNELLYNNVAYKGTSVAEVYLYGLNISYDDSDKSGLSIYGTIGGSLYKAHSGDAKNKILFDAGIPSYIPNMYPNNFSFEDETYYGAASALGFRYDFMLFRQEFFINPEWFHTFGDWNSGNQGNLYNGSKINQTFEIRDDSYYLGLGYVFTENLIFIGTYQYLKYEEDKKIGAPCDTISHDKYIGRPYQNREIWMLQLRYKF